jgi:PAS domain-containing protein
MRDDQQLDAPPSSVARASTREAALLEPIDAVPEHVFVLGPDFSFVHANRALLDYHGRVSADVPPDRDAANLLVHHPDDVKRLAEEGMRAVAAGSALQTEARVLGKDGTYRWFPDPGEPGFATGMDE